MSSIQSRNINKNKGTYQKANIALSLSVVGLAAVFPFQHSFVGGLLTSGFSAALVGGLADWFAVNALFRRPLGVPPGKIFRTEIIPRNRERIYQALTDMVQDELLSKEALKNKLLQYDFSNPFVKAWKAMGVQSFTEPVSQLLKSFAPSFSQFIVDQGQEKAKSEDKGEEEFIIRDIDTGTVTDTYIEAEKGAEKDAGTHIDTDKVQLEVDLKILYPVIGQAVKDFSESKEGKEFVETFLETLCTWARTDEAHEWLANWLDDAVTRYINGSTSRKFLTMFLPTSSALATSVQEKIEDVLLEDSTSEKILAWLTYQGEEIVQDPESEASKAINHALHVLLNSYMDSLAEKINNPENVEEITTALLVTLEANIAKLQDNPEQQSKFNKQIQSVLIPLMETQHEKIGRFVREGLERYTDDMLVELIESKAGEDLQMIRINGSVVGGLAGILIYLLNGLILGGDII